MSQYVNHNHYYCAQSGCRVCQTYLTHGYDDPSRCFLRACAQVSDWNQSQHTYNNSNSQQTINNFNQPQFNFVAPQQAPSNQSQQAPNNSVCVTSIPNPSDSESLDFLFLGFLMFLSFR